MSETTGGYFPMTSNRLGGVTRRPIRRRKASRWLLKLGVIAIIALGLTVGSGVGYIYFQSPVVRGMMRDRMAGRWEPKEAFPNKSQITVMLLGRDKDRDRHGRALKTNGRSDTIMLAHLDFVNKTANILSIPRDTMVRIPGHRGRHKINAAHAYGGPELTAETIDNFLGVRPDEYVAIDYESFEKALDMIGGLHLNVTREMNYDDNWGGLHIHLKPGDQQLTGTQALGYVRYRKSNDGHGVPDQDRIARQQQFIMATKQKIIAPSTFFRIPDVIGTIRSGVNSSLDDAQLMCVAQFIKNLPPTAIHSATLPSSSGRVYVTADDSETRELVRKMFN
jgi:polyisoprenyl-teichoic acid--peptidoglycan teichoic acid transferase